MTIHAKLYTKDTSRSQRTQQILNEPQKRHHVDTNHSTSVILRNGLTSTRNVVALQVKSDFAGTMGTLWRLVTTIRAVDVSCAL